MDDARSELSQELAVSLALSEEAAGLAASLLDDFLYSWLLTVRDGSYPADWGRIEGSLFRLKFTGVRVPRHFDAGEGYERAQSTRRDSEDVPAYAAAESG